MDFMDVINEALKIIAPYTKTYNSEEMHLGFFDPDKFEEELDRFCRSEGLRRPPLPEHLIPAALPIPPNGIFISGSVMDIPNALLPIVISSVFHLFFFENQYDGNMNDILMDYPEVSKIPDHEIPDLMNRAADMHRIVLHRRIGYGIWSAFLADFMTGYIVVPFYLTAEDVSIALDRAGSEPGIPEVAEFAKAVLGCPDYAGGEVGKNFTFSGRNLPFQTLLEDLAYQLGQEKYYKVTPEFLCNLGRDYEKDLIEFKALQTNTR